MAASETASANANRFCRDILPDVSRTFALSIRILRGELGRAVRDAYLLCRIADTIEDEPNRPASEKAELFDLLTAAFEGTAEVQRFVARTADISGEPAHVRLTRHADLVFQSYRELSPGTREIVSRWVREMIVGMRKFTLAYPAGIRIRSLAEYREYCYYVAGTVGFMLTDLWREHSPGIGDREYRALRDKCQAFAEALQTVNILKDVARDAREENSIYVPDELLRAHGSSHDALLAPAAAERTRAALSTLVDLAWHDLDDATRYLLAVPRRAVGIRLFCALPLLFAYATLRDLTRSPQALVRGDVVKISRAEVKSLTTLSMLGVFSNRLLAWLVDRTKSRAAALS